LIHYPPKKQHIQQGLRVICYKWGDKYSDDYVLKLKSMCERHLPHREFVCVTDKPVEGVNCNPLIGPLPSWWGKIHLFQRGLFPGDNIYIDLDVVITANLTPLAACLKLAPTKLWTVDDFGYPLSKPRAVDPHTKKLLGGVGTINSSVMLWRGDTHSEVYAAWDKFTPDVMEDLHGDQNWITQALYPQSVRFLPDGYVKSFKYEKQAKSAISVFHGDPKPHEVREPWVVQNWT